MSWLGRTAGRLRIEAELNAAYWVFMTLLLVEIVHMFEHAAQLHQSFLGVEDPKGFLGAWFDFVWVHFAFNAGVFLTLLLIWALWRRNAGGWRTTRRGTRVFGALLVLAGYHAMEHIVQVLQYTVGGQAEPVGLIGLFLPLIVSHFDLNAAVLAMLVAVYVTLRPARIQVVTATEGPGDASALPS